MENCLPCNSNKPTTANADPVEQIGRQQAVRCMKCAHCVPFLVQYLDDKNKCRIQNHYFFNQKPYLMVVMHTITVPSSV